MVSHTDVQAETPVSVGVSALFLRRKDGTVRLPTLVDPADAEEFGDRRWHVHSGNGGKRYAARRIKLDGKYCAELLHREIMCLDREDPREVDHINGDGLDNRRENLRVVTHLEQMQNRRPQAGYSRHRGVTFAKRRKEQPWHARAQVGGRVHHLGYFDTEDEAAEAAASFRRANMPFSNE